MGAAVVCEIGTCVLRKRDSLNASHWSISELHVLAAVSRTGMPREARGSTRNNQDIKKRTITELGEWRDHW
jgi:hypothetical protein